MRFYMQGITDKNDVSAEIVDFYFKIIQYINNWDQGNGTCPTFETVAKQGIEHFGIVL